MASRQQLEKGDQVKVVRQENIRGATTEENEKGEGKVTA